jgi:NIMA (never in mitosis gene a)-related kinase
LTSPKSTTLHSAHHQFAKINGQAIGNKMSDFRIVSELGRGSYGVVYRVESLKDQLTYVLKKINLAHMKQKN